MTRTPAQAIARAHNQSINGPRFEVGFCLRETRKLYDVPARYSSAAEAWSHTKHRIGTPDTGALVWWTGGSHSDGHVAISTGGGYCYSVDIRRPGYFDKVPIDVVTREWGLKFAGYSRDINDVTVLPAPAKPTPRLDHALEDLTTARDARPKGSPIREKLRTAIQAVRTARRAARR